MTKKIAVIGLPPVCAVGIRNFLKESGVDNIVIYSDFDIDPEQADKADGYVISSDLFALRPDFFMMRRNKLAVYCRRKINVGSAPIGMIAIYEDDEESLIRSQLDTLCCNIFGNAEERAGLTNREIEVLKRVAAGLINKEIADELSISVNTVITHRKNISEKLGIRSVSGLSLYALMNGLV